MNVFAYVRVSTRSQSYEVQEEQIVDYCKFKGYTLLRVFADKKSGATLERPEYKKMMETLEENPLNVEAVVVTKIDRVGRSIRDLLKFIDWLKDNKIDFVAFQNNIDTTSKEGRLFLYIMGALSEYERELIMERTEYGREAFLKKGGRLGRKIKNINVDEVRRKVAEGVPVAELARQLKVSRGVIYKRLNEGELKIREKDGG